MSCENCTCGKEKKVVRDDKGYSVTLTNISSDRCMNGKTIYTADVYKEGVEIKSGIKLVYWVTPPKDILRKAFIDKAKEYEKTCNDKSEKIKIGVL